MSDTAAVTLPAEPIVALDELQSEEALTHPIESAIHTIVEALADAPLTRYLARPGHERQLVAAQVALDRSAHRWEVVEAHDFRSVALVREVPEAAATGGEEDEEEEEEREVGEGAAEGGQRQQQGGVHVDTSRAEASANVERPAGGGIGGLAGASGQGRQQEQQEQQPLAAGLGGDQLREAMQTGSVETLLAAGVARLEAELLVHVSPERVGSLQQMRRELRGSLERYCQAHGPLLHLHYFASRPEVLEEPVEEEGEDVLKHLGRMADAEGRTVYAEAGSEQAQSMYLRHGFREVEKVEVEGEGAPSLSILARPPGSSSVGV